MNVSFVQCKTLGHAWEVIPTRQKRGYKNILQLRCVNCGTERFDALDWRGELLYRYYEYPEGYKDAEKMPKPELRILLMRSHKMRIHKEAVMTNA